MTEFVPSGPRANNAPTSLPALRSITARPGSQARMLETLRAESKNSIVLQFLQIAEEVHDLAISIEGLAFEFDCKDRGAMSVVRRGDHGGLRQAIEHLLEGDLVSPAQRDELLAAIRAKLAPTTKAPISNRLRIPPRTSRKTTKRIAARTPREK